jgi:hypothetical protein
VQDNTRNVSPICAFGISVEKPQVRNKVLFVIRRQLASSGSGISDIGIERWSTHLQPPKVGNARPSTVSQETATK